MDNPKDDGGVPGGGCPDGVPPAKGLKEARAEVDHERQTGTQTTAVYGDVVEADTKES